MMTLPTLKPDRKDPSSEEDQSSYEHSREPYQEPTEAGRLCTVGEWLHADAITGLEMNAVTELASARPSQYNYAGRNYPMSFYCEPVDADTAVSTSIGDHVKIVSPKPYEQVKEALEASLHSLSDVVKPASVTGESGAQIDGMHCDLINLKEAVNCVGGHGGWLSLDGEQDKTTAYLIGDALFAGAMMTTGEMAFHTLFQVVLSEDASGDSVLEYDCIATCPDGRSGFRGGAEASILEQQFRTLLISAGTP